MVDRYPPGGRILDPACGTGRYFGMILQAGRQVVGVDGLDWVLLVAWLVIAGLPLLRADRYSGRTEWLATSWVLAGAVVLFNLSRRAQSRRRGLLAQLEAADQPNDATR